MTVKPGLIIILFMTVILGFFSGCTAVENEIIGTVIEINSHSLTQLSSLTVRDETGNVWVFSSKGFVGMTPSHLEEHRHTLEKIRVTFVESQDGSMTILRLDDAE